MFETERRHAACNQNGYETTIDHHVDVGCTARIRTDLRGSDDRHSAPAACVKGPACLTWARLYLGRGLLVSGVGPLPLARRLLDAAAVSRRALGGVAPRWGTLV